MNELFAADPCVCKSINDLKLLMSSFGPYAGRYLANYPIDWVKRVENQYETIGQIEAEKAKVILRRAKESLKIVTRNSLFWNNEKNWIQNVSEIAKSNPNIFSSFIGDEDIPPYIKQLEDLELPPTAGESIQGVDSEYIRVCKILLLCSPEIIMVDPYINPLRRQYKSVLTELLKTAAKGQCQRIVVWTRASEIFRNADQTTMLSDVKDALRKMIIQAELKAGREVEMIFVDDAPCKNKMHARYLLSIKGGVRLDQGFQYLPGRRVDVGPVDQSTHVDLLKIYLEDEHDMRILQRFTVKA
ncbi:MAG TPA: hypothetical protein DCX14_12135 [Flavobacteriales bacterium]|nr:hypothetical protein [Flavobacteriales bacterium]